MNSTRQLIPKSGLNNHNPLGLSACSTAASLFLLDLNVLFDLAGPRRVRHPAAVSLFQAERMDLCKLAVSDEVRKELRHTAATGKIDPMEGFIDILPTVPLKAFDLSDGLFRKLAEIIFPEHTELTRNDKSDLCHIATAIQYELTGLITNDGAVLEAAPRLWEEYGIEILSPAAFTAGCVEYIGGSFEGADNVELTLQAITDEHTFDVHNFLSKQGLSTASITSEWLPTGANSLVVSRFGLWSKNKLAGYLTWSSTTAAATTVARIAADPDKPIAADAVEIMLAFLLNEVPRQGPKRVNLELPRFQPITRDVAIKLGFRGHPGEPGLFKVVLGAVLTEETWPTLQKQLQKNNQIRLPDTIPKFQHPDQQIPIIGEDGNRHYVALDELESVLAPALICLTGRPAVITPIKRDFAEPLLGHAAQRSLLPSSKVSIFEDRHYISASRNLPHFKRGTLILFYESKRGGGNGAIVAIARVRQAYLKQWQEFDSNDLERSIFSGENIKSIGASKTKTITVFDNIFVLPRQVPLTALQKMGCGSAAQLRTTNSISALQLHGILREAFSNG